MIQYFTDSTGNVSKFTDAKENYRSQKVKAEDISVLEGTATAVQIADDHNYHIAKANGRVVGWRK